MEARVRALPHRGLRPPPAFRLRVENPPAAGEAQRTGVLLRARPHPRGEQRRRLDPAHLGRHVPRRHDAPRHRRRLPQVDAHEPQRVQYIQTRLAEPRLHHGRAVPERADAILLGPLRRHHVRAVDDVELARHAEADAEGRDADTEGQQRVGAREDRAPGVQGRGAAGEGPRRRDRPGVRRLGDQGGPGGGRAGGAGADVGERIDARADTGSTDDDCRADNERSAHAGAADRPAGDDRRGAAQRDAGRGADAQPGLRRGTRVVVRAVRRQRRLPRLHRRCDPSRRGLLALHQRIRRVPRVHAALPDQVPARLLVRERREQRLHARRDVARHDAVGRERLPLPHGRRDAADARLRVLVGRPRRHVPIAHACRPLRAQLPHRQPRRRLGLGPHAGARCRSAAGPAVDAGAAANGREPAAGSDRGARLFWPERWRRRRRGPGLCRCRRWRVRTRQPRQLAATRVRGQRIRRVMGGAGNQYTS
mmetsp:Transcript_10/g.30  ORF Transcript_10/g.30 Transcript_10/m.30 type:complete len:479 (+) Transcript_10:544-1980(+)